MLQDFLEHLFYGTYDNHMLYKIVALRNLAKSLKTSYAGVSVL